MTAVGVGAPVVKAIGLEGLISPLPSPLNLVGPVDGIAMGVGVVYLIVLYVVNPQRIRDTGKVFLEEGPEPAVTSAV